MVAVLLGSCKAPRNDEIALQHFFFLLAAVQDFFSIAFVLHAIFFSQQALAGNQTLKTSILISIMKLAQLRFSRLTSDKTCVVLGANIAIVFC